MPIPILANPVSPPSSPGRIWRLRPSRGDHPKNSARRAHQLAPSVEGSKENGSRNDPPTHLDHEIAKGARLLEPLLKSATDSRDDGVCSEYPRGSTTTKRDPHGGDVWGQASTELSVPRKANPFRDGFNVDSSTARSSLRNRATPKRRPALAEVLDPHAHLAASRWKTICGCSPTSSSYLDWAVEQGAMSNHQSGRCLPPLLGRKKLSTRPTSNRALSRRTIASPSKGDRHGSHSHQRDRKSVDAPHICKISERPKSRPNQPILNASLVLVDSTTQC